MSLTVDPGFAQRFGRAAGGNDFDPRLRENLSEGNQTGFVGNGNERALNFCHSATKSSEIQPLRRQTGNENYFAARDHVLADGAMEFCARRRVIVQRLDLRRARLRERRFGVEHVELRAGAGFGALLGFAQRFIGLFLDFFLRIQSFARLDKIGIRRAHLQFDLARLVVQHRSWIFRKFALRLLDFSERQRAVKNVPR